MQKLESNWKTMWEKLGTDPHNEKEGKREARKQKFAQADDELLRTSAKRGCSDKAKSGEKSINVRKSCGF